MRQHRLFAVSFMFIFVAFLAYTFWTFLQGMVGALILYVVFEKLNKWFVARGYPRQVSAFVIMIFSLIIICIPFILLSTIVFNEFNSVSQIQNFFVKNAEQLEKLFPDSNLTGNAQLLTSTAMSYLKSTILSTIGNIAQVIVQIVVFCFSLYYLLLNHHKLSDLIHSLIPLSAKNTQLLIQEFSNVTHSVLISTGVIGLMQGILLTIGFSIAQIPSPFLWGFVGVVLSVLPFGVPIVWVPAVLYAFVSGNSWAWIFLLIWGIFVSNVDSLVRPFIQEQVGKIHPLVSLLGVFIGLKTFGLIGVILGPLLISYGLLIYPMVKEEYFSE